MSDFCVYLTVYSGNRLPPFYIGSTSSARLARGYVGSVVSRRYRAIWKEEHLSRPHLFRTVILARFQTRDAAYNIERSLQKQLSVIKNPLYVNLSYGHKETAGGWNAGIPAWNRGKTWSPETIDKIRRVKSNPSAATRAKISAANKGRFSGDNNPSRKPGVGAKITAAKKGVPLGRPSWHSGRTGVYSAAVVERMSKAKMGIPNPIVAESNRRRAGLPRRKKGEGDVAFTARFEEAQAKLSAARR